MKIFPAVKAGKNVLVAAHGNSLRAVVMYLDQLTREEVLNLNLATGVPIVYDINAKGKVRAKQIL